MQHLTKENDMAKRGNFRTVSREEALKNATTVAASTTARPNADASQRSSATQPTAAETVPVGRVRRSTRLVAAERPDMVPPTMEARRSMLSGITPRRPAPSDYARFRAEVVDLVSATPYASRDGDATMVSTIGRYLEWAILSRNVEALRDDLTEVNIADYGRYLEGENVKASSVSTAVSRLRSVRSGGQRADGRPRKHVGPPHSQTQARHMWSVLDRMSGGRDFEARVLWTLTFGCGLRSEEVQAATSDWVVDDEDHGLVLRVAYTNGEYRCVPVPDPELGNVLRRAASEADACFAAGDQGRFRKDLTWTSPPRPWLLSPHMLGRKSVIFNIKRTLGRVEGPWNEFDARRARNCWLLSLLESELAHSAVCQVAGLSPFTKTPSDLLEYVGRHSDASLCRAMNNLRSSGSNTVVAFRAGRG